MWAVRVERAGRHLAVTDPPLPARVGVLALAIVALGGDRLALGRRVFQCPFDGRTGTLEAGGDAGRPLGQ